jgi:hypothetical protein
MKEPDWEPGRAATVTRRRGRIVLGRAVLSEDQAAGRTCCYCPLTFGRLDPVAAPGGVEGVLFLAAHRSCIARASGSGGRVEGGVAAGRRRERS